jgi:hypothetical protein
MPIATGLLKVGSSSMAGICASNHWAFCVTPSKIASILRGFARWRIGYHVSGP